jgi:hypothetical protein
MVVHLHLEEAVQLAGRQSLDVWMM